MELRLFAENTLGLSSVYNIAINESRTDPAVLVFIHDDVHLCDFNWAFRVVEGLEEFHIIGVAGNKRRVPRQPSWAFTDDRLIWDNPENLSGIVGHGTGFPCTHLSAYGVPIQEVKLLDGLLLACRSQILQERNLSFDERFDFHFHDLAFLPASGADGPSDENLAHFVDSRKRRQARNANLEERLPKISG